MANAPDRPAIDLALRSPRRPRLLLAGSLFVLAIALATLAATVDGSSTVDGAERVVACVVAALAVWLGVAVLRMGDVRVRDGVVTVRDEVRTRRFEAAAISSVELRSRRFLYARVAPTLVLRSGPACRLADFSTPLVAYRRRPTTSVAARTASTLAEALGVEVRDATSGG